MNRRKNKRMVYENNYVAEVEIELFNADDDWSPRLSLDDVYKLDDVRAALRDNDIANAVKLAKVYQLTPLN